MTPSWKGRWVGKPGNAPTGRTMSHWTESPLARAVLVSYRPGSKDVRTGFASRKEMVLAMHHAGIGFGEAVPHAVAKHLKFERVSRRQRKSSGAGGDVAVSSHTRAGVHVDAYTRSKPS